jgi:hypothetical protein
MRIAVLLTVLLYASIARALSTSLGSSAGSMSRRASAAAGSDSGIVTGTAGWLQKTITITAPSRGCHIITHEIEKQIPDLSKFQVNHQCSTLYDQARCTNSASLVDMMLCFPSGWHSTHLHQTYQCVADTERERRPGCAS